MGVLYIYNISVPQYERMDGVFDGFSFNYRYCLRCGNGCIRYSVGQWCISFAEFRRCASNTLKDFLNNFKGVGLAFKDPKYDNGSTIAKIIELSNVARKEGLLALEEVAQNLDDEFMKKGILLIVDGTEPELVRGILETELMNMDERHRSVAGFFETWAALGPAWGMIGTLIGLVNMLKDLQDSSAIGPSMATALLTTLYGSLIANWFCTPIANKLKEQNSIEYQLKEIVIEGLLSIQAGENPRVIEEKLKSFLAPASRNALSTEEGGGEA